MKPTLGNTTTNAGNLTANATIGRSKHRERPQRKRCRRGRHLHRQEEKGRPPEEADICSDFCHGVTAVHCQRRRPLEKTHPSAAEAWCGGRVTTPPQSAPKDLVVQTVKTRVHRAENSTAPEEAVASLGCQLLEARAARLQPSLLPLCRHVLGQ